MAQITIGFEFDLNISIHSGDTVFYTNIVSGQGGSNHPNPGGTNTKPKILGVVVSVDHQNNSIIVDNAASGITPTTQYLMFSKNKLANYSGITGYYAEAEYRNFTTLPAEIFATGADYAPSSK